MDKEVQQLNIRNFPKEIILQLQEQARKSKAASFSQYVIEVLRAAVVNEGFSYYNNEFADALAEQKEQQLKLKEYLKVASEREILIQEQVTDLKEMLENMVEFLANFEVINQELLDNDEEK